MVRESCVNEKEKVRELFSDFWWEPGLYYVPMFNCMLGVVLQDQSLGSWQLKHSTGEEETAYKFHRSVHIKPGTYVTVWSSDVDATHQPPHDLVMKGQRWFVADNMTSTLLDNKGQVSQSMYLSLRKPTKNTYKNYELQECSS